MSVILRTPGSDSVFFILELPDVSATASARSYNRTQYGDTTLSGSIVLTALNVYIEFGPDEPVNLVVLTTIAAVIHYEQIGFTPVVGERVKYSFGAPI